MNSIKSPEILAAEALRAPSADNSQPLKFVWDGSYFRISYDSDRVTGHSFPADHQASFLTAGCAIDIVHSYVQNANLSTELELLPKLQDDEFVYASIKLPATINGNLPSEAADRIRFTNRFAYKKQSIPGHILQAIEQETEGEARVQLIDRPGEISAIASQVYQASKIRFQTREVHEWLGKSLRFGQDTQETGDGLDIKTLDLPPAGGHFLKFICKWSHMKALNHIGMYKLMASIDSQPVKKAPAILAFTGGKTPEGMIEAGRLLNRTWTMLNTQGIACHPYYVVSDQMNRLEHNQVPEKLIQQAIKINHETRHLLQMKGSQTLMMLLRIGYPRKPSPPKSLRLPVSAVYTDISTR